MGKINLVRTAGLRDKFDRDAFDLIIPAVSTSKEWSALSPFFLGPCRVRDGMFHNVENVWQFSKVYPLLGHLSARDGITEKWYAWYAYGMTLTKAQRYPAGKGKKPAFSFYRGKRLSLSTARKLIYIPYYAHLAAQTEDFKRIRAEYEKGARVMIQDFDCYQTDKPLDEIIEDTSRSMGHGFVLAAMLEQGPTFYQKLIV
jgi:hypothetical protein